MLPVVATLRLPDGRVFNVHAECDGVEGERYYWTDGNNACDCNRTLYLNREYGLGLVGEPDVDCWPCGNTIELVALTVDGKDVLGMANAVN